MRTARKPARLRPRAKTLMGSMREFLTSAVFRQVRNTIPRRKMTRWDLHPLLYILLLTTWCCGDSLPERFEAARAFYVISCPKRKRPGKSCAGFEKAVAKLPIYLLRAVAAALRGRITTLFGERLKVGEFMPLGCDGTRQEGPRSEEPERRLGTFGKEGSPPMIWNTSIVHLVLGFPWCWRFGIGGKASERHHLLFMLKWLPKCALIVADAGYVGYDVIRELMARNVQFLIRMSSQATRERRSRTTPKQKREWPRRKTHKPPKPPLILTLTIEYKNLVSVHGGYGEQLQNCGSNGETRVESTPSGA